MKPYLASLINAIILVLLGLWGYLASQSPSLTALIPVFIGIILGALAPSVYKGNRTTSHVTVILTFLVFLALVKPLTGVLGRNDPWGIIRVVAMMGSSFFALAVFIKGFIEARRH